MASRRREKNIEAAEGFCPKRRSLSKRLGRATSRIGSAVSLQKRSTRRLSEKEGAKVQKKEGAP